MRSTTKKVQDIVPGDVVIVEGRRSIIASYPLGPERWAIEVEGIKQMMTYDKDTDIVVINPQWLHDSDDT